MNSMQEWSLQDIGFARLRQEKLVPFLSRECVVTSTYKDKNGQISLLKQEIQWLALSF